jgi:hypothetical protein
LQFNEIFESVAHKRLAPVDLPHHGSHQHELNGSAALRSFFGDSERTEGRLTWMRFADDCEPTAETGQFTFYDARAKSVDRTGRSEWRLYYSGEPLADSHPGDLLVLAKSVAGDIHALVFAQTSGWERAAVALFPVDSDSDQLRFVSPETLRDTELDVVRRTIIEQLGFDYAMPEAPDLTGLVIDRFGLAFPTTAEMGHLARELADPDPSDPDALLLGWIDMEEQLFRSLERTIVGERIERGFEGVEDFLGYSLSVQNRRKSRMGHAFENHLAALFDVWGLRYDKQVRTEGNRTADFVFPGASEYRDAQFPTERLTVLAAKSTCKDRWPQVLADADRIPVKHLGTLDATLTSSQLTDMASKQIVPVIPKRIRETYASLPAFHQILDFEGFLSAVALRSGQTRRT